MPSYFCIDAPASTRFVSAYNELLRCLKLRGGCLETPYKTWNDAVTQSDLNAMRSAMYTMGHIQFIDMATVNAALAVSIENSTHREEYDYDYMGRRWRLKTFTKSGNAWVLDSEKIFVYNGYRQIAEFTMNGTVPTLTATYLWQPGLDGIILRAVFGTAVRYFIPDGNRNIIQLRDATGAVTDSYAYGPFGQCAASGATPNPFRFSCEYLDASTGLVYYNYRHYHPGLGRWTSRDPLEENELFYYAMAANNTISFFDCLGLKIPEIFYSPFNSLKKYHLPSPGILFGHNYWYGNWGGPNWAAGQDVHDGWNDPRLKGWKAPDREGNPKDVYIDPSLREAPIDALDACYMVHDYCYEKCREPYRCITKDFWGRITDVKEGDPSLIADCYTKCDFESVPCQLNALMHLYDTFGYAINNRFLQGIRLPIRAITAFGGTIGLGGQGLVRKYIAPVGRWIQNQGGAGIGAIGSAVESTWIGLGHTANLALSSMSLTADLRPVL